MQEEGEPQHYPTTTSLRQSATIGTSGVVAGDHVKKQSTSSLTPPTTNGTTTQNTNSSNSKNSPGKTKKTSAAKGAVLYSLCAV